jgi:hypothetical protein
VDSEKLRTALSDAGYKVGMIADHVPYDLKGNVIDGPAVRDIVRAIKEGRGVVPPSTRPSPRKAATAEAPSEIQVAAPAKAKAARKKAPVKKAKRGGVK